MNSQDPIETQLGRLPLRSPPPEWRATILAAARAAAPSPGPGKTEGPQRHWLDCLQALLWPSPRAWAVLAGFWLVALTLQWTLPGPESSTAAPAPSPAELTQRWQAWQERRRYMAELMRELTSQGQEASPPLTAPARPPRQTRVEPPHPPLASMVA